MSIFFSLSCNFVLVFLEEQTILSASLICMFNSIILHVTSVSTREGKEMAVGPR